MDAQNAQENRRISNDGFVHRTWRTPAKEGERRRQANAASIHSNERRSENARPCKENISVGAGRRNEASFRPAAAQRRLKVHEGRGQWNERERLYRAVFEGSRDGIVFITPEGRIVDCNSSYAKMLGYTVEELCEKWLFDITPVKWHEWEKTEILEGHLVHRGFCDTYEKEYVHKSGTIFRIEVTAHCLDNPDGTPYLYWGVVRDITERRQRQKALIESERRFRIVADYAYDWVYWRRPDGGLGYVSPSAQRITGRAPQDFFDNEELYVEIVHPEDRETFREHVAANSDCKVAEKCFRIVHADKGIRWIHHVCYPIWTGDGEYLGVHACNRDITGQLLLEAKTKENEKIFRQLVESIHEIFFLLDRAERRLLYVGPAVETILGIAGEEVPRVLGELENLVLPEDRLRLGLDNGWIFRDAHHNVELRITRPDGKIRWLQVRSFPIHDESGAVIRVAGVATDITLRKLSVEREKLHAEQLQQADKMAGLGVLVSGVAHEINNPNNFIMLNGPILRHVWNDAKPILDKYQQNNGDFKLGGIAYSRMVDRIPQLFDGIENGTQRIRKIVTDLKNYAGKDPDERETFVEANCIVSEAVTLLKS
ncbi:MAG: PAS domain S-box protein, partial [Chitinivibrionales bacterium]|nr:PAS domain S-box protein [Chitinivibrionales bacterium]MBD3356788.1 PAS domain S-box protein [Chitinivibrionales bacterium]